MSADVGWVLSIAGAIVGAGVGWAYFRWSDRPDDPKTRWLLRVALLAGGLALYAVIMKIGSADCAPTGISSTGESRAQSRLADLGHTRSSGYLILWTAALVASAIQAQLRPSGSLGKVLQGIYALATAALMFTLVTTVAQATWAICPH